MRSATPEPLKLLALDSDDLKILSAHLQDAVLRVAEMIYLPSEQRFAAIVDRFDWLTAGEGNNGQADMRRCRCALRFDRVQRAQVHKVHPGDGQEVAELLAVTYEEIDPPGGYITMFFAGGGAVRLKVECIEAQLRDLGVAWHTAIKPEHVFADTSESWPAPASPEKTD